MKRVFALCAVLSLAACASARSVFLRTDPLEKPQALFAEQKYAEVIALLPAARIAELPRRHRAEAYHWLGLSYDRRNEPAKALQIYQLGVGLFPRDLKLLSNLADVLNRFGLHDRARPYYERVLAIHPNNAGAHLGLADIYRKQGYLTMALRHFQKALQQWRDNPYIWRDYAEALADAGMLKDASAAIRTSLDYLDAAETQAVRARIERLRGRDEPAYAAIALAAAAAPERGDLRLEQALWLLEDNRLDETLAIAESLLGAAPAAPLAHWLRAAVFLRRGDPATARAHLAVSAAASHTHPFIAKSAQALLAELDRPR